MASEVMEPDRFSHAQRRRETQRVTLIGAGVNALLAVFKILFGWIAQSQALIADGVHSLSDLLTDAMVYFAAHHAHEAPDAEHPYGHGRYETVATMALGVILVLVAAGIIFDAVYRLFQPERLLQPTAVALVVAAASILANEALYRYTLLVAQRIRSPMLKANAWHHRSDAVSSVVVMVGVGGDLAGLPYLDAIAAVAVGLMIVKMGWNLGWSSVQELVDSGLEPERLEAIRATILSVGGVRALHMLRTRHLGGEALADVHVQVEPWLSVSEGHMISENVRSRVVSDIDEISDVTVHIDPEDDESVASCIGLPLRSEVLDELARAWAGIDEAAHPSRVMLHYLDGRIAVDLCLPIAHCGDSEENQRLRERLAERCSGFTYLGDIRLYFGPAR